MDQISKPLLWYIQIFGFFILSYTKDSKGRTSLGFSTGLFLWASTIVTIQTVSTYYALYADYQGYLSGHPILMSSGTTLVVTVLDMVPNNLTAIVVFFSTFKKYKHYIHLSNILEQVDRNLKIKVHPGSYTLKPLFIIAYVTVLIHVNLGALLIENASYMYYLPTWSCYYVQLALFFHFTFVAKSIERRFLLINEEFNDQVMKQSVGKIIIKDLSLPADLIPGHCSVEARITILIDSYTLLCEAVTKANLFYSSKLLTSIFSIFIHIIITLYFFFLRVWPKIEPENEMALALQGIWALTHITSLVMLVQPSTQLSDAASETGAIICRLLSTDLDRNARKWLETFLLQLLHFNTRFTALGFFQVHSPILTSIASSVTTYLVILIQFQISNPT